MSGRFEWEGVALFAVVALVIGIFIALFVYVPISLNTDAKCLAAGYPKSAVTWNFQTYCMNLDGSVTVRVDGVPE